MHFSNQLATNQPVKTCSKCIFC
uniref:Uncharacterized protein n=1 Tax=Anguilla anguilla TaxID=7936 RepID=A0A0E9R9N3_ANGAN